MVGLFVGPGFDDFFFQPSSVVVVALYLHNQMDCEKSVKIFKKVHTPPSHRLGPLGSPILQRNFFYYHFLVLSSARLGAAPTAAAQCYSNTLLMALAARLRCCAAAADGDALKARAIIQIAVAYFTQLSFPGIV
jgi:hypothetical protein